MVNGDVSPVFLDTNVLVFATVIQAPFHRAALRAIQSLYDNGIELWISRQVLREYLAVLTRPQTFTIPQPVPALITDVRDFQNWFRVAEDNHQVTENLLTLMDRIPIGGAQVHDANIVATMQVYGVNRILTNNAADFDRFTHLITVLPL